MAEEQKNEESNHNCEEYLAGWKRAQADYANLKKETERDRIEFIKYANERLLQSLLPAIDQYETALAYTPSFETLSADDEKRFKNWLIGIQAVKSLWENTFKDIGLERVPTTGPFDPQIHEAVGHENDAAIPADNIIRAVEDGWRLHGRLLRPAKVIISEPNHQNSNNQEQSN